MKPTGNPRDSANYGDIFKQHGAYLNDMAGQGHIIFAGYTDGENPGELSLAVLNVCLGKSKPVFRSAPIPNPTQAGPL
jgi:hypothetical protein